MARCEPRLDAAALTTFFEALVDPNRLRILGQLAQKARTVEQLAGRCS